MSLGSIRGHARESKWIPFGRTGRFKWNLTCRQDVDRSIYWTHRFVIIVLATILFTEGSTLWVVKDYHVSIHSRRGSSLLRAPIQNLSFSAYGPNNLDKALQSTYRRTLDNIYIQPLPNGNVIPLRARNPASSKTDSHPAWGHTFSSPMCVHSPLFQRTPLFFLSFFTTLLFRIYIGIFDPSTPCGLLSITRCSNANYPPVSVAVFDILKSPNRRQPFVLLQPSPHLEEILPGKIDRLPNRYSAFIGLVEETGSLFAMGPENFPLVIFSDANSDRQVVRLIDGPSAQSKPGVDNDFTTGTDPQTKDTCRNGSPHRKCLTGLRPLEEDSRSRISRLLDGIPSVALPPRSLVQYAGYVDPTLSDLQNWDNTTAGPPQSLGHDSLPTVGQNIRLRLDESTIVLLLVFASIWSLFLWSLWLLVWFLVPRVKARWFVNSATMAAIPKGVEDESYVSPSLSTQPLIVEVEERNYIPPDDISPSASVPPSLEDGHAVTSLSLPVVANNHAIEQGNDGEDSDRDVDAPALGKRKGRRGKRGKRKKAAQMTEEDQEDREDDKGDGSDVLREMDVVVAKPDSPSAISTPSAPVSASIGSPLVVSDTILGEKGSI